MKLRTILAASALIVLAFSAPAAANSVNAGNGWTCTAQNIANATYSGGRSAYIHLRPYRGGQQYRVSVKGNRATGRTSNGTQFTCTKN